MDLNKVGKLIVSSGKNRGLTQNKLSELLGVNEKTVSKWSVEYCCSIDTEIIFV